MSTVALEVPVQLYGELQERAETEQTDIVALLRRLLADTNGHKATSKSLSGAFQKILDRATDLGVTDLAEQHDHYLYGTDKV